MAKAKPAKKSPRRKLKQATAEAKPPRAKRAPAVKVVPTLKKAPDLDLRTLVRLSMGDWSELADLQWPPDNIRRWLENADVRQVRGMLLTTLHRWHELRNRA